LISAVRSGHAASHGGLLIEWAWSFFDIYAGDYFKFFWQLASFSGTERRAYRSLSAVGIPAAGA
jgi:hypothetical protein